MEKGLPLHLQEIIFTASDKPTIRKIAAWEAAGEIKKIAPRIYTGKMHEKSETLIRRNIFTILGQHYPGAVLSHRTALEFKPTDSNSIFLTYTYTKKIELPGIILRILEGPGPVEGDNKFVGELYVAQPARAYLENMQVSRKDGPDAKTLTIIDIEERLEKTIQVHGEDGINKLRDQARQLAGQLSLHKEFDKLNRLISALLSTHTSKILVSPAARARAFGAPYDGGRIELFEKLFVELQQRAFKKRPDKNNSERAFANFAFYESYFSNYIEGTVFKVSEAKEIIETQKPLPTRDEDSHDVLGTYQLVSNRQEMHVVPASGYHLLDILQYRHRILLSARPSKQPGIFKDRDNYAGNTAFVPFDLVKGTLIKAWDYYNTLGDPFAKAIFIMFVVSEVHPFLDGNGRLARVMMNAELVKADESKIIIPTVYRDDYIGALRKLTRRAEPDTYIRMMQRAHEFSANVYGDNRDEMEQYLTSCNAFLEDTEGKILEIVPRS